MARTYTCAACGAPLRRRDLDARRVIYSQHTGNRYCPAADTDKCNRRRRRNVNRKV